ncbi:hypothetical protein [Microvirga tunisiensis]|uniref:Uncharacterized protein n=1 Tax=Microvirga tunisiensis TaxID=2108360 RepID=A0A5N7MQT4_9HYPH|nr:hypothetical protein [Microvirga tunisiensis]MPR08046.1 hypothetical protein [Microvirga tunisiensis]MPR26356.1 hypothetical protein [Microvirga tunisiensis]
MGHSLIKLVVVCVALTGGMTFEARPQQRPDIDVATPEGLPAIGRWMLTAQSVPSDWLGEIYEGRNLREPINVIIVDQGASSADDAKARLLAAAARAGYPIRFGHSTGYQGFIGGQLYAQLPQGRDDAFSNDIFEVSNNHGRIFGPHQFGRGYLFARAFSREEIDPLRDPPHSYGSFNRARDDFTQRLDRSTDFKVSRFVDLGNALIGDPKLTTGDHDGIAVVVRVGP